MSKRAELGWKKVDNGACFWRGYERDVDLVDYPVLSELYLLVYDFCRSRGSTHDVACYDAA